MTTVLCLAVGSLTTSFHKAQRERQAIEELVQLGVSYDDWIGWREMAFGHQYRPIEQVSLPSDVELGQAMKHLVHLDSLKHLSLGASTDDADLAKLQDVDWITSLDLSATSTSPAGLRHLEPMSRLRWIYLPASFIGEQTVAEFQSRLPRCKVELRPN